MLKSWYVHYVKPWIWFMLYWNNHRGMLVNNTVSDELKPWAGFPYSSATPSSLLIRCLRACCCCSGQWSKAPKAHPHTQPPGTSTSQIWNPGQGHCQVSFQMLFHGHSISPTVNHGKHPKCLTHSWFPAAYLLNSCTSLALGPFSSWGLHSTPVRLVEAQKPGTYQYLVIKGTTVM